MARLRARLLLAALVALPWTARADDDALVPGAALDLSAVRYEPTDTDLFWTGSIGGGVDLFRRSDTTGSMRADVETVLGNSRRAFEATQANYSLEPSLGRRVGPYRLQLFFHHVSRHRVDREKPEAVDWNVLGVRAERVLGGGALPEVRVRASLGKMTQQSLVGYRWEATLGAESDVWRRPWGAVYGIVDARLVLTESSGAFERSAIADLRIEGGATLRGDRRYFEGFVAFEHRADVRLEVPGSRNRVLIGIRMGLGDGWVARRFVPGPQPTAPADAGPVPDPDEVPILVP